MADLFATTGSCPKSSPFANAPGMRDCLGCELMRTDAPDRLCLLCYVKRRRAGIAPAEESKP